MAQEIQEYRLTRENLIPFYLIEDRIKENFSKVETFISRQLAKNNALQQHNSDIKTYNQKYKEEVDRRFIQLQKKIVNQINASLEGQIILAINKNMTSFSNKIEEKSKEIQIITAGINEKLQNTKKNIIFEVSKDNQKYFAKEAEKLQKKLKNSSQASTKASGKLSASSKRPPSRDKDYKVEGLRGQGVEQTGGEMHFSVIHEQMTIKFKQVEQKLMKFQEFSANVDKRLYDNMTSLKQSWKQLGEEMLQTKKKLTLRQDDLKLQLIKIRGIKQFDGAPQDFQETFKAKLMNKFSELYQLIGSLVTKIDLESSFNKNKKVLNRHDSELIEIRAQLAKNNDYFTFYANNSNEEDLFAQIQLLREQLEHKQLATNQKITSALHQADSLKTEIDHLHQHNHKSGIKHAKVQYDVAKVREDLLRQMERIDVLEDSNKLSPLKMAKIHNTLDIDFTPSQQELLAKKSHNEAHGNALKQMKGEIHKLKDELFVVSHEMSEIEKVKKNLTGLQSKLNKLRFESEEAMISRKPWVCLSCDKNQKERQEDKGRKQSVKKKVSDNKGLFVKQGLKSEKMMKVIASSQQKFEIYQKYRQKYLSDSVRLPDIYRQKIGEKEP